MVIVPREFYLCETHFFSLLLKTLSHHQNRLYSSLLNTNETLAKTNLRDNTGSDSKAIEALRGGVRVLRVKGRKLTIFFLKSVN